MPGPADRERREERREERQERQEQRREERRDDHREERREELRDVRQDRISDVEYAANPVFQPGRVTKILYSPGQGL